MEQRFLETTEHVIGVIKSAMEGCENGSYVEITFPAEDVGKERIVCEVHMKLVTNPLLCRMYQAGITKGISLWGLLSFLLSKEERQTFKVSVRKNDDKITVFRSWEVDDLLKDISTEED